MKATEKLSVHVALLRGINVGGKNKLPMKELAHLFASAGCSDVRTYIQSGNVVFRLGDRAASALPAVITAHIDEQFGLRVPVVMRSAAEMAAVTAGNPYLKAGVDEKTQHVFFLADFPEPADAAKLDPQRSPGDSYSLLGREIYACLPNGMARTKLTNAYFDSKLKTTSTARNWSTVIQLAELMK